MARTGDVAIASSGIPQDFVTYIRAVTGQDFSVAEFDQEPGVPLFTRDIMGAIDPELHAGKVLNPYLQWDSIRNFSEVTDLPNAFSDNEVIESGLVQRANDKAFLYAQAGGLEIPQVHGQQVLLPSDVPSITADMLREWGGVFIQGNLSGGGLGNLDLRYEDGNIYSGKFGQLNALDLDDELSRWVSRIESLGSNRFIAAPLLNMHASHTVSGFVPESGDGEPFTYGVFGQVLEPVTHDYAGFKWPAGDALAMEHGRQMQESTLRWLQFLQDSGYVGPSDLDFLVGSHAKIQNGDRFLGVSESNTRWDGFRFGMQHVGAILNANPRNLRGVTGENSVAIKTLDHVGTRADSTDSIVSSLKGRVPLFGLDHETEGVVVMVPPNSKGDHYETGIAAIGDDMQRVEALHNRACDIIG